MKKQTVTITKKDKDFDFCKELNELMDIQDRINRIAKMLNISVKKLGKRFIEVRKELDKIQKV